MAKSLAPKTVPQLVELLAQSGLLVPESLEQARKQVASTSEVPDAVALWVASQWITPWQGTQLAAGQFVLKLGPYVLLEESGEWDFGRAFEARHAPTRELVSLKLLANRWLQPEELWRQTASQLKTAQALESPRLAPFQKVQRVAQRTILISPHESSSRFQDLLTRFGPPTPDQVARLVREAALGIAELHQAGLSHGCLRPERFTIKPDGTLQVHDLGLAPLTPAMLDLRRQAAVNVSPDSPHRADPFLPAETGLGEATLFRWDVRLLAQLGLVLLNHSTVAEAPSTSQASHESHDTTPTWWQTPSAPSLESAESLRRIFAQASDLADASWTAARLAETVAEWISGNSRSAQPPAPTQEKPALERPTPEKRASEKPALEKPAPEKRAPEKPAPEKRAPEKRASEKRASVTRATEERAPEIPIPAKPSVAATTGVRIDTQKRRKRPLPTDDHRLAGVRRLRRRRATWLYGSLAATVLVILLLASVSFWGPPSEWGGVARRLAQQNAPVVAPDAHEAGERDAEQPTADGFPNPDSLDFPTPEIFAAVRAEADASRENALASAGPPKNEAGEPLLANSAVQPTVADLAATEGRADADLEPDAADPLAPSDFVPATSSLGPDEPNADMVAGTLPAETPAEPSEVGSATPAPEVNAPASQLAGLPMSVAIPDPEDSHGSRVAILPLAIKSGTLIELTLLGGDRVLSGNSTLQIDNAEGGTAERMWDVRFMRQGASPTPVARLTLEGDELMFEWLEVARERPELAQLMNCALNIAAGAETHRLFLRRPVEVAAPAMDFARGISTIRWEIPHAPATEQCRLEFLGLEGPFPETRQLPNDTLAGVQGDHWIMVGKEPAQQGLTFHLTARWRRQIEMTITSLLFAGDVPPPQLAKNSSLRFTTTNRRRWLQASEQTLRQANQNVAHLNVIDPKSFDSRGGEQEYRRQKNLAELDLQTAQLNRTRIETLEQWARTMHEQGKLHFRIYFEFGGNQVELLRTQGAPPQM